MNTVLTVLIAAAALVVVMGVILYDRTKSAGDKKDRTVLGLLVVALLGTSFGVYASIGHFSDWQDQQVDNTKDHRLAAKITETRRQVQNNPRDVNARMDLASRYMEGGLFSEAVNTLEEALQFTGPRADIYGMKANAAYYRDGRKLSPDAMDAIEKAQSINPNEIQSGMLLAQDAFLNKHYQKAIDIWQGLLSANADPSKNRMLQNAILNAKIKMAQEPQNNDTSSQK